MTTRLRRVLGQLSLRLAVLVTAIFLVGVGSGWLAYLHRSPVRIAQVPGTSAWWQQLILAALTCVVLGFTWWRHRHGSHPGGSGQLWLLAPLGKRAAGRVTGTALAVARRQPGAGRAALALPPAALFLYCFWRAGFQVTAGLDPNATVNAWGGPTYAGAMACHYLDAFVLAAVAAWLLSRILLPETHVTQAP